MGNITAYDQLPSPLRTLNEDNMIVLLRYLDVPDYVHLSMTCRKFLHDTLGSNNYLWAQLLNRPMPLIQSPIQPPMAFMPPPRSAMPMPTPLIPPPTPTILIQTHFANHVLQTTRNGRKFEVDGKPLDLTVKFDTLNKKLVGYFDFRSEIKMYVMKTKCSVALGNQLAQLALNTNAFVNMRVEESVKLDDYYVPAVLPPNDTQQLLSDVIFVANLGVDPVSLERITSKPLVSTFKSRRVVYQKNNTPAFNHSWMFSRSRMPPPPPPQHYNQQLQQYPTVTSSYPTHFPTLPNKVPPPPQPQPLYPQPYATGFYPSNPPPVPQHYYPPQPQQNFYPPPPTADGFPPRSKPQQPQQYVRPSYAYPGAYPNQPQPQPQPFVPVQPPQIKPVYAAQQQQQKKKNSTAYDQLPSPLRTLNEDNMVVLLQYLDVSDYVHMTQTCRQFLNETLGSNNYLWAQLLNRPMPLQYGSPGPIQYMPYVEVSTQVPATMPHPNITPLMHLANHVLQTTRNGRKFEVDGKPLDLTVKFDTLNKKLVGHFDFRSEIKMYYMKAKCAVALFHQIYQLAHGTNASTDIQVAENAQLDKYIVKNDAEAKKAVTDVTFVVDLGVDLDSLEKLKKNKMPSVYKSRRIVYHKRDTPAFNIDYMSRARMMPPIQPIPMPYPVPLANPQYQPSNEMPPIQQLQIGSRPVQPSTASPYASQVPPRKSPAKKK